MSRARRFDRSKRVIRVQGERHERPWPLLGDAGTLRASVSCGGLDCPRAVIEAKTPAELRVLEWAYRCPRCGRPDEYSAAEQRRWHARQSERRR